MLARTSGLEHAARLSRCNRPQEADEEQLRTADDAAATVAARLAQLASERAALEEHRDATARELQSAKASLEARRAELSRLQGEARSSKCAPVRCTHFVPGMACRHVQSQVC